MEHTQMFQPCHTVIYNDRVAGHMKKNSVGGIQNQV